MQSINTVSASVAAIIVAFQDSWGGWWAPCRHNAAGARAFGPTGIARRISRREAKRCAAAGRVNVGGWDGECDTITALPGAVRVMRKR